MTIIKKKKVSLFDFINDGTFDTLQIGQTKKWILNNFCEPDRIYYTSQDSDFYSIAEYGSMELHFEKENNDEVLFLIYSDGFNYVTTSSGRRKSVEFGDGNNLIFQKWIFDDVRKLNLNYVISMLLKNRIDFRTNSKPELSCIELHINNSEVCLHFETNDKNADNNLNKFWCCAFWLIDQKRRTT